MWRLGLDGSMATPARGSSPRNHPAESCLLVCLLVFGSWFALAVPLGAGWDEETHLIRVWDLAHWQFIPNDISREELPYPTILWDLSYRRQLLVRPVEAGFWSRYGSMPLDGLGYLYDLPPTRSVYSPPLLLPYALVFRYLGLKYGLGALPLFYIGRLVGLACYAASAWSAVRLIPFGKWTLAVMALAPTAVFQAATIGADPVSNGLALLFTAGCLAVAAREHLDWKAWLAIVALTLSLFWAKVNLSSFALLPLLVLPPGKFRRRRLYLFLLGAILVLGLVEVAGWAAIAYPQLTTGEAPLTAGAQLSYALRHPLTLAKGLSTDFWLHGVRYLRQWVAEYGYGYGSVPWPTYLLFALALLGAWWTDSASHGPSPRARIALSGTFAAALALTWLTMYVAATPVGADEVLSIQGRYYIPIAPLLGLALLGMVKRRPRPAVLPIAVGFLAAGLATFGLGLMLSYHVVCGTAYYAPGLCYLPVYKNWAPNERFSLPIASGEILTQEILVECNGLSEVRVWVDGSGLPAEGRTRVVVRDPSTDRDLAQQTVANRDLPEGGWLALPLQTTWHSSGKLYLLTIRGDPATGSEGARIALTLRDESPEVMLTGNAAYEGGDIVFRYGCAEGLARILHPLRLPVDPDGGG